MYHISLILLSIFIVLQSLGTDSMRHLILGSGSKSRRQILESAGHKFTVFKAEIDEKSLGDRSNGSLEGASRLVTLLANAKADALQDKLPQEFRVKGNILLTADQVVTCRDRIMEKPRDIGEARLFIKDYSKGHISTVGSIALTEPVTGFRVVGVDTATVYFDKIPDAVIESILADGESLNCAGGLMVEHPLLQPYISRIDGSVDSVMGLSLNLLTKLLNSIPIDDSL